MNATTPTRSLRSLTEGYVRYGPERRAHTPRGMRIIREAVATPEFWHMMNGRKEDFQREGIYVRRKGEVWMVMEVSMPAGEFAAPPKPSPQVIPTQAVELRPDILAKLLPWQPDPTRMMVRGLPRHRSFLDASDMGMGKTAIAVATCAQLHLRPVVICNTRAVSQWWWMLHHFGFKNDEADVGTWTMIREGKTAFGGWQNVRAVVDKRTGETSMITRFKWAVAQGAALVFDEIHKAGGGLTTKQGKMLIAAKRQGYPIIGLSATAASSILRFEALGYALGLFASPHDFIPWMIHHGIEKVPRRGFQFPGATRADRDRAEQAAMLRVHREIFGRGKGVRLRKSDVPLFPQNTMVVEAIDFEDMEEIAASYQSIKQLLLAAESRMAMRRQTQDAILQARRHIELLKVPTLAEVAEEAVEAGHTVIVFMNFRDSAFALAAELTCPMLIGQQKDQDKVHADLQANRIRKLVCTYGAGSESMDMHDTDGRFPRFVIHNPHYSAVNIIQATGRTPRANAKSKVIQKFLFAAGTVEESVMEVGRSKMANIETLNDGCLLPYFWSDEVISTP